MIHHSVSMNYNSVHDTERPSGAIGPAPSPILLVPYMWIGDFVRGHSVVRLLQARWPGRPIDMLSSALCAPLVDFMPGLRRAIVCDLPRGRLPLGRYLALAGRLRTEGYRTAL